VAMNNDERTGRCFAYRFQRNLNPRAFRRRVGIGIAHESAARRDGRSASEEVDGRPEAGARGGGLDPLRQSDTFAHSVHACPKGVPMDQKELIRRSEWTIDPQSHRNFIWPLSAAAFDDRHRQVEREGGQTEVLSGGER
jgi:hypothetical protein